MTNPKDLVGATKTPLSDVPAILTVVAAPVFALGARKYGRFNWRKIPIQEKRYVEAMERHLLAYKDGERIDDESRQSHLAHIIATAAIVIDAMAHGTLLMDDDAGLGAAAALMAARGGEQEPPVADQRVAPGEVVWESTPTGGSRSHFKDMWERGVPKESVVMYGDVCGSFAPGSIAAANYEDLMRHANFPQAGNDGAAGNAPDSVTGGQGFPDELPGNAASRRWPD